MEVVQVVTAWMMHYTSHQVNPNQHKATEVCLLDIQNPLFVCHACTRYYS